MLELSKLHPIHIEDLIRVGRDEDGGYVISKQQSTHKYPIKELDFPCNERKEDIVLNFS